MTLPKLDALELVKRVRKTRDAIVAEDDKGALVYWSVDMLDRIIALMERGAEVERHWGPGGHNLEPGDLRARLEQAERERDEWHKLADLRTAALIAAEATQGIAQKEGA